jgi:CBS domain-containing protein
MTRYARDVMTPDPACCTAATSVDEVAKLMLQNDCGEIPVVDTRDCIVGVVTDRDIVCRVVAIGKNPIGHTAAECMTSPVVTVREDMPLPDVLRVMEEHRIRRVPVVDADGACTGIIAQADVAHAGDAHEVAELVREVSHAAGAPARRRQSPAARA